MVRSVPVTWTVCPSVSTTKRRTGNHRFKQLVPILNICCNRGYSLPAARLQGSLTEVQHSAKQSVLSEGERGSDRLRREATADDKASTPLSCRCTSHGFCQDYDGVFTGRNRKRHRIGDASVVRLRSA